MSDTKPPCEYCQGRGEVGPVHINRGDKPHEWRMCQPCSECAGTGYWSDARYKAWVEGQALRRDRILNDLSIRDAAKMHGISPSELSAIEWGRKSAAVLRQQESRDV